MSTTTIPRTDDSKLEILQRYCELGWKLLPVWEPVGDRCACGSETCVKPGKHPNGLLTPHWDREATSDWDQVRRWFDARPTTNWGWAQEDHFTLDVDPRNGFTLSDLDDWSIGFGFDLPLSLIQDSGGGGRHLIFNDDGEHVRPGYVYSNGRPIKGLDVKGNGGYILVEPSIHASGGEYRWRTGLTTAVSAPVDLRKMFKKRAASSTTAETGGDREWTPERVIRFFEGDVPEGEQNTEIISYVGYQRMLNVPLDNIIAQVWVAVERWPQDPRHPWTFETVEKKIRDRVADIPAGRSNGMSLSQMSWIKKQTHVLSQDDKPEVEQPFILNFKQVLERPPIQWLIQDVMPERALFQLFGQTGQYKSFIVIDLLAQLANGQAGSFLGKEIHSAPGLTCMILGEGGADIGERVRAWQEAHPGMAMENIYFIIEQGLNLLDSEDVNKLGQSLADLSSERDLPWRMIIFDTQADHMMGADENDAKTFSALKPVLQAFTQTFGACVGLVHHTGWDDSRERGSARQRQMLDVVMESKDNFLYCRKQKAGPKFETIPFRTVRVGDSLIVQGFTPDDIGALHNRFTQVQVRNTESVVKYLRKEDINDAQRTLASISQAVGLGKTSTQEILDKLGDQVTYVVGGRSRKSFYLVEAVNDLV